MRFLTCLTQDHDPWLVALAASLCLVGSTITIRLLQRLRGTERASRLAWVFMGGVSTGATIWCTHFVAMIAYQPGVEVAYDPTLTGASLIVAILGSAVAMHIGSQEIRFAGVAGGVLFGLTVTAMHYTGMQAFAADGMIVWSQDYVVISILGAVLFGGMAFERAQAAGGRDVVWLSVGLMVASIVTLHFTGMAAMAITPFAPHAGQASGQDATLIMAFAVAGVGMLVLGTGISTHALDAQALAETRRRLDELLEGSVDGMVVEQDGAIAAANLAFAKLVGVDHLSVVGQSLGRWVPDIVNLEMGGLTQTMLVANGTDDIPVEIAVRIDRRQNPPQTIYSVRDLRARIAQERRIAHLARNDSLTGLPNRASFLEWLSRQTVSLAPGQKLALLSIDLDRFKEVNDTHGHAAGDQLLIRIAQRMKEVIRTSEFVARLGGDEFVALMPVREPNDVIDLVDRLRDAVTAPALIDDSDISCGLSVGVAIWPLDAADISSLINNADLAMYRAKSSISTDICFYEEDMDAAVRARRQMAKDLRTAIDSGQLALHWQCQTAVSTGKIIGYEALLRWTRPDGTSVSPAEFIPLAETSGLILQIGEWVLRTACLEAAGWKVPHKVAVNLSPVQLGHVDLPRLVHQILLETGLPSSRLELEITETAMITDPARTVHILHQLKTIGVSVAMDDFGTGYSSLSTLRSFPFDKIKLDRSFMTELGNEPQSAAIIRAVLALGESLAIPVLAEGVETPVQLSFLRDQGCDEAQGYLLGRPGPINADGTQTAPTRRRPQLA